ncbi:hypothetical protein [Actinokineospora sp. PR83]|uniref:hypothetical protein n=1 Tax=Actinokineospora sp. PR83 TaxID=2884908 RepID=UPI002714C9EE|nr:hypothetical protein [Actinokineospora sp. PR83]
MKPGRGRLGRESGCAALKSGQIPGKRGEKFKAGKLGEYTTGADGEIVLGRRRSSTPPLDQYDF